MRTALLVLVAACGSPAVKPAPVVPNPKPIPAPAPVVDPLNLDFEVVDGELPKGWSVGGGRERLVDAGTYFKATIDHDAHHGATSLKIASIAEGGHFLPVATSTDGAPYRAKHVRLHGWVKTDNVAGAGAALWLRGDGHDGQMHGFDNMDTHGVKGTTGWHEIVAESDFDDGTETLVFGVMLMGPGAAWFDSLSIEVKEIEKPVPIVVGGHVFDSAHKPLAGAEVSLCDPAGVSQHITTDAGGAFTFHAMTGTWSVSAHHAPDVATFGAPAAMTADTTNLELQLGASDGVTLHVRATSAEPIPAGAFATVSNVSSFESDIWSVPIIDGAITAVLPRARAHTVSVGDKLVGHVEIPGGKDRIDATLAVSVLGPAPDAVVTYLRDHATALVSPEAGHGFADMAGIGKMVGNAHVVALGEATHGTREFFQLKHRFLEYLVAEKGFSVFAIEANQPECRAINDYIQNGKGDAKTALAGIYFWTWNTEEVLAMIEWMRVWNQDPKHVRKLEFTGFDMQTSTVAYKNVADYLGRVSPDNHDGLLEPIKIIGSAREGIANAPPDVHKAVAAGLTALAKHLDDHKAEYVKLSSAGELADIRHDVTILQQWQRLKETDGIGRQVNVRDESMAANMQWLRAQRPTSTKFVLWAHNGHVRRSPSWMGSYLTKAFGKDYVVFGFIFGEGSFQAMTGKQGSLSLRENTLGPAPEHDLSAPFTKTGKPVLVVDLRTLPNGPVARWFAGSHPMRETGAVFSDEKSMTQPEDVMKLYDALIFVAKTTRAVPVKK